MGYPILKAHRLLTAAMAVVALTAWAAYAYTAHSFKASDRPFQP